MAQYSKIKKDLYLGLATMAGGLAFGLGIPFQVSAFSEGASSLISGRTLPSLVSMALLFLGALQTWFAWRELKTCSIEVSRHARKGLSPEFRRVACYAGAVALYLAVMKVIGFELASFLMLIFAMRFSGCRSKAAVILVAVLTPALIYLVFAEGMYMNLPDSWLRDVVRQRFF